MNRRKSPKTNMIAPVALDQFLYYSLLEQADKEGVSMAHILRRSIRKLKDDPSQEYPDHKNKKTYRAPSFLVDDEELSILVELQGESIGRNTIIRNALWAYQSNQKKEQGNGKSN